MSRVKQVVVVDATGKRKTYEYKTIGGMDASEYHRTKNREHRKRFSTEQRYPGRNIPVGVAEAIRNEREKQGTSLLGLSSRYGVSEWAVRKVLSAT